MKKCRASLHRCSRRNSRYLVDLLW